MIFCSYKTWVNTGSLVEEHDIVFVKLPKLDYVKNQL